MGDAVTALRSAAVINDFMMMNFRGQWCAGRND
jgi:hypothetical protein